STAKRRRLQRMDLPPRPTPNDFISRTRVFAGTGSSSRPNFIAGTEKEGALTPSPSTSRLSGILLLWRSLDHETSPSVTCIRRRRYLHGGAKHPECRKNRPGHSEVARNGRVGDR